MSADITWIEALRAAVEIPHMPEDRLYFNGEMFCWCRPRFIRPDSGWMLVGFIPANLLEQYDEESVCAA